MKKIIIAGIVLILVGLGLFLRYKKTPAETIIVPAETKQEVKQAPQPPVDLTPYPGKG